MDFELLEAAKEAGARLLQPARCESIEGGVRVRHLDENRIETLEPTWIMLADGKGALLPNRPAATTDFGLKAHFESVNGPVDAVELFGVRGHYVGLAPIEGGRCNVAMSLPTWRLEKAGGDFDRLWRELLGENPNLADRFAGARRAGDWLASPLPRFGVARKWPAHVIPLGNAAAALEPIGGEGMGLAMRSAELAAEALAAAHETGIPLPVARLRARFNDMWRRRRIACRGVAKLLSNPALAGPVIDWAAGSEALSREVLGWMGKTDA
jgi:2-polyprenyl-6-methoxyphenol hydroxylase-like FAD-dependent oxidoreductase